MYGVCIEFCLLIPLQCDETKPTCNQCAKSRRQCPGYKDEFDLVFRNETQATERRARKANQKALAHKQGRGANLKDPNNIVATRKVVPDSEILTTLNLPVEQRATCHFVSNYVLIPQDDVTRGYMEFVVPMINAPAPHFKYAFDACALASLGNRVGPGNNFEKESLGLYTKALSATFAALKDPKHATSDATLGAVLLLGLFENITAKQLGMLAWGFHIEGAMQLVKARGKQQVRTKVGLAMFVAVRTQMVCTSLNLVIPKSSFLISHLRSFTH